MKHSSLEALYQHHAVAGRQVDAKFAISYPEPLHGNGIHGEAVIPRQRHRPGSAAGVQHRIGALAVQRAAIDQQSAVGGQIGDVA